jgi:calcineurin-like phosphoesterase family protein
MTRWFTADQHFGHENILDYCKRPFDRVGQMDRAIILKYREVVKPEDTVYFLGDLTIKSPGYYGYISHIVEQLPGTKILVIGNHDKFDWMKYHEMGFQSVHTILDIGKYILCHDPAFATYKDRNFLCGHTHTLFLKVRNCYNVGVDVNNFYPVSEEEVDKAFEIMS